MDSQGEIKIPDALKDTTEVYRQRDLPPAANCGRVVGVRTSGVLAQAALEAADDSTGAAWTSWRFDFGEVRAMRAGRPTTRKIRAMPAWISPAVRALPGRQGAGLARPGMRAGSVWASI